MPHASLSPPVEAAPVLLVGRPNVGKSALFGALTGRHSHVSNYPGTTVNVSSGRWHTPTECLDVLDTPGAYSLLPVTDEERVARDALFLHPVRAVLHVVEAANLDRSLPSTLEMLSAGLPLVLVLNLWDEAERLGIRIDTEALAQRLGCPVVRTVAVRGEGVDQLAAIVGEMPASPAPALESDGFWVEEFGDAVDRLAGKINGTHSLPASMPSRVAAALVIRGSKDLTVRSGLDPAEVEAARRDVAQRVGGMPPVAAILALRQRADKILEGVFHRDKTHSETLQHRIGMVTAHPVWGIPIMLAVLYIGFYQVVGVWAAGDLVGFLEETVFGSWLLPGIEKGVHWLIPVDWLSSLFIGPYGILTLGITYALALVLPVVGAFFVVFSIVEDSGYFPRLALLCDRMFKRVGLNGRAVITMVLGLGCATMATVTTRTLEKPRDRIIATLLLVLTIPCSAQLGLIMSLLGSRSFTLWVTYVLCLVLMFLVIGFAAARVLPGRNATFHMELVPMRWPRIGNVLRKTWNRLYWYFREVVPLFVFASVILWLLDLKSAALYGTLANGDPSSALKWIEGVLAPCMSLLDLPREAAESFLIGFFRRDFGAVGLFKLSSEDVLVEGVARALTDRQMLVASFTMTLFVPCVASFMMMWKERGGRTAWITFGLVTMLAIAAGAGLNVLLLALGWK